MGNRLVRMGIDVRGTHTKTVVIDNTTYETIGKSSVKTTHDDRYGVAAGVVKASQNHLRENDTVPEDVIFAAHSTTQATSVLIEGDIACVDVLGMGPGGMESFLAEHQTRPKDIDPGSGRSIRIKNRHLNDSEEDEDTVRKAVKGLKAEGAQVLVASDAYGADNIAGEQFVFEIAHDEMGVETAAASGITRLYGPTRRTRTAAINASTLTKMLNTANSTEESVKKVGVEVPFMIMCGDDGVMGPLMYLRASNDVCFEMGGTTTNIGVIKNGRPVIGHFVVGGHRTYVGSLDVRVPGVAGGSMIRVNKSSVHDVGPRPAHIAGLGYVGFTDEDEIVEPRLELFSPKEGVPEDYVAARLKSGKHITVTNSCAANVLGLVTPKDFSYGSVNAARKAMQLIADYLHITMEDVATQILTRAYEKIEPIIMELDNKYHLGHDQISPVGVGGGATSLIGFCANKMNIKYDVPENAEVIPSIGVVLAMVRDVVERVAPNPTPEGIRSTKREAVDKAVESSAASGSAEVYIETDPRTSKLTGNRIPSPFIWTAPGGRRS